MADGWHPSISGGSRPRFDSYLKSPEEYDRDRFLAAPSMDRNKLSGSSTDSRNSTDSYQDQGYAESPLTSCGSPQFEGDLTPQYNYLSLDTAAPSREPSARVFLFDIERYGDPRIEWIMYYDFIVTKSEAHYQLQPGYLPTEKYPSRVPIKNGDKLHPCRFPNCKAKPFTRHYDLERHFKIHGGDNDQVYCDYKKCFHTEPFRKDHCREHYREYHAEDLVKRGSPKHSKSKQGQKPETVDEFLAARLNNINLSWWRCSKCVKRVQVNDHGYKCPKCNLDCEPVRVAWREKALTSGKGSQAADSITSFSSASSNYVTDCGQCQNTWLPDEEDPNLWVSCPTCRPGVKEMTRD